jgi:hypothetical protein
MIYKLKWEIFSNPKKKFFYYIYIKTAVTPVTPVTPFRNPLLTRVYKAPGVTAGFFWLVTPVTPDDYLEWISYLNHLLSSIYGFYR